MQECEVKENTERCSCTYVPCDKKGFCCKCVLYHQRNGELPGCFFPDDIERTYNRSIEKFIEIYQKRGRWW